MNFALALRKHTNKSILYILHSVQSKCGLYSDKQISCRQLNWDGDRISRFDPGTFAN